MIGTHIGTHWVLISANGCQVPTLRCQCRAGCRPCWIQRPTSWTREKWGSKRISDMMIWWTKNHSHHILMGFVSWILMNQVLYWNKATHSADPFCRLADMGLSNWAFQTDLCVQRASMTLITDPQISTVFLCCGTSAKHWKKTRSEGKTSSTLALYLFCLGF